MAVLICAILGICSVISFTIGAKGIQSIGLLNMTLLSAFIGFMTLSAMTFFIPKELPRENFEILFLLPGILTLALMAGIPWLATQMPASHLIVTFVTFELAAAISYDYFIKNQIFSPLVIIGLTLSLIGVTIVSIGRNI